MTRIITKGRKCLVFFSSLPFFSFYCILLSHAVAKDTLRPGEVLRYNETLVSAGGIFQLGFFNPGSSKNLYMGILFKNNKFTTAVWVPKMHPTIPDYSGKLSISLDGNLEIMHNGGSFIIGKSELLLTNGHSNTSATLLDTGNLVLRNGETIVWQSFDHPFDTFLAGMKLGLFNTKTGHPSNQTLTSWLSPQVPKPGAFTLGVDPNDIKQLAIWQRDVLYWRSGNWNERNYNYILDTLDYFHFSYISNENESYFTYKINSSSANGWFKLRSKGAIEQSIWLKDGGVSLGESSCDPILNFLTWGCETLAPSGCSDGDTFLQTRGMINDFTSVPDSIGDNMGLSDCKAMCRYNCSCLAFSLRSDETGCQLFYGKKRDIVVTQEEGGNFIYIRGNQTNQTYQPNQKKRKVWFIITGPVAVVIALLLGFLYCIGKRKRSQGGSTKSRELLPSQLGTNKTTINDFSKKDDHDLPLFSFSSIEIATENFSLANKLGEGGFGPVYKGKLPEGQEIAVKRLSVRSNQGLEEFKNEVALISKLQHRNLVKILGCCIQGEEKILIYEYMQNKSLDSFLFDSTKQASLDWRKRVGIIEGIAQGLLYLHKYSSLRIIHRDLKTSNILLDSDMNPKISDFGTARIFGENESQAKTKRIIGTYGYMSPEYAMDGLFSVKSDVFSFGVMMLEILSGKKNVGFYQSDRSLNLLQYVWELWTNGNDFELMDPTLNDSCPRSELMRHVHVALLCVQESATNRPTMSDVTYMLSHEATILPPLKKPSFSTNRNMVDESSSTSREEPCSINGLTLSKVDGR